MRKIYKKIKEKLKKHLTHYWRKYLWVLVFIIVFSLGATAGYFYLPKNQPENSAGEEKNIYVTFLSEVYDKIKQNYWEALTDEELGNLFKLTIEESIGKSLKLEIKNKDDFKTMMIEVMKIIKEDKKKEFSTAIVHLVLQNLKPAGRSALYTVQEKKDLDNRVKNVNPETGQVEPTVIARLVRSDILHLYIKKISPTTLDELKKETEKFDNIEGLDSLIIDLRGNVGGSIDILPYLSGPFIGKGQYAYEFYHQEEYTPFKTETGWLPSLVRYKKVIILIDSQTQSSAEVLAAIFKKYNVGILVGTTTKGWGTIEAVLNLENQIDPDEKYSIFLVHSLTLRDDNQPIQNNGVNPTISINDPGWEQQLFTYFHYEELVKTVKEIWNKSPY